MLDEYTSARDYKKRIVVGEEAGNKESRQQIQNRDQALGLKWIFKRKLKYYSSVECYKARPLVQRLSRVEGEILSDEGRSSATRVDFVHYYSLAMEHDLEPESTNRVDTIYLNVSANKELSVKLPANLEPFL